MVALARAEKTEWQKTVIGLVAQAPMVSDALFPCPYFYQSLRWRHNGRDLRLKSPALPLFTQPFIQAQIKENIKAPRHWPLCGEFTGDRWIPGTIGQ